MNKRQYTMLLGSYPSAMKAAEVAEVLRVSTKTVYKLIREQRIPAVKVGRELRIAKFELIRFLCQRESAPTSGVDGSNTQKYIWTFEDLCDIVRVDPNEIASKNTKGADANERKTDIRRKRTG